MPQNDHGAIAGQGEILRCHQARPCPLTPLHGEQQFPALSTITQTFAVNSGGVPSIKYLEHEILAPDKHDCTVTRVRFPSPAPLIINHLRNSASKVQVNWRWARRIWTWRLRRERPLRSSLHEPFLR